MAGSPRSLRPALAGCALAVVATAAPAQSPRLVQDVGLGTPATPLGSDPFDWAPDGVRMFFVASDPGAGREVWISDGTPAGTRVVADVSPGLLGGSAELVAFGGGVFFSVGDGLRSGLWATAGTAATTLQVRALGAGPAEEPPRELTLAGGRLVFVAADPTAGSELWTSDGTSAGTRLLVDLRSGRASAGPRGLTPVGARVLFSAHDDVHGREPWITDGTAAGTRLLVDAVPGPQGGDVLALAAPLPGARRAFFAAGGLWVTDGTPAGTVALRSPLVPDPSVGPLACELGGSVYFAADDGMAGSELWATDGTPAGTRMVSDLSPGAGSTAPVPVGVVRGRVVFGSERAGLWATTGTAAATFWLAPVRASTPGTLLGPGLVFNGSDASGIGVFRSDGTSSGTVRVRTGLAAVGPIGPALAGRAWFAADHGDGLEPWVTDGTPAGTGQLADLARWPPGATTSSSPRDPVPVWGGLLACLADPGSGVLGPYLTDAAARAMVPGPTFPGADPFGSASVSGAARLLGVADRTFAIVDEPGVPDAYRLYLAAGTASPSLLASFVSRGGRWEWTPFRNGIALAGGALWISDGTSAGTRSFTTNPNGPSDPSEPCVVGAELFFVADDGRRRGLFRSDGRSVQPLGAFGLNPRFLTAGGSFALFVADDGVHGEEPWVSDGTPAGTRMLADLVHGPSGSLPQGLAMLPDGALLFRAFAFGRGVELWSTDGTPAGTAPLPEIVPGAASPVLREWIATRRGAAFALDDLAHGSELWVYDAAGGARLVADLFPGPIGANPSNLTRVGDEIWFVATEPTFGASVWRSDGTAAGTVRVDGTDLRAWPRFLAVSGGRVFLDVEDLAHGRELWVADAGATAERIGTPCGEGVELPRLDASDPVLGGAVEIVGAGGEAGQPGVVLFGLPPAMPRRALDHCVNLIDPTASELLLAFPDAARSRRIVAGVPADPAFVGGRLVAQSWCLSRRTAAGIAGSAGLLLTLGLR
ncbi:MAG: hypothetical protein IPM29_29870 [Planctomycetes bacterium]|nr:hypothetical protein [Planctomycetota bacterium]